jgi:hypothetical protein
LVLALASACIGCAGATPASQVTTRVRAGDPGGALALYESRPPDIAALVAFSEALLEREALSGNSERERVAFSELAVSGQGARPLLERLALPARSPRVRARALLSLARLGDDPARSQLRTFLEADDDELVDLAIATLRPDTDRARLLTALQSPRPARRLAALSVLARSEPTSDVRQALATRLKHDPAPAVRAAAAAALPAQGETAFEALTGALSDADLGVQAATAFALVRLDLVSAEPWLSARLGSGPTQSGLVFARALLSTLATTERARASEYVRRALAESDQSLRAAAIGVLSSVPRAARDESLVRARLAQEPSPDLRLSLASLLGADDAEARQALVALAEPASVRAVNANTELALAGDAAALARLQRWVAVPDPALKRVLSYSLISALDRAHDARALLADADRGVRLRAAAWLLASQAPGRT